MLSLDFLDRVPQFPGGPWVNHAVYGTILGTVIAEGLQLLHRSPPMSWSAGAAVVLILTAVKKWGDYVNRGPSQGETLLACIGKTIVTTLGTVLLGLSAYFY